MLRKFLHECRRVLRVARKPDKEEYLTIAKVTSLGIVLIGFVGFLIMMISILLGALKI